jgi:hypothetical protein
MSYVQHEIKIVVYTSRMDGTFVADVYFGDKRIHCGGGPAGQTSAQAMRGAVSYLQGLDARGSQGDMVIDYRMTQVENLVSK